MRLLLVAGRPLAFAKGADQIRNIGPRGCCMLVFTLMGYTVELHFQFTLTNQYKKPKMSFGPSFQL